MKRVGWCFNSGKWCYDRPMYLGQGCYPACRPDPAQPMKAAIGPELAVGDTLLTAALSGAGVRRPLSADVHEHQIRLNGHLAALDLGTAEAIAILRGTADELQASVADLEVEVGHDRADLLDAPIE